MDLMGVEIRADGAGEEGRLLGDDGDGGAESGEFNVESVDAVDGDAAGTGIYETEEERVKRALSCGVVRSDVEGNKKGRSMPAPVRPTIPIFSPAAILKLTFLRASWQFSR